MAYGRVSVQRLHERDCRRAECVFRYCTRRHALECAARELVCMGWADAEAVELGQLHTVPLRAEALPGCPAVLSALEHGGATSAPRTASLACLTEATSAPAAAVTPRVVMLARRLGIIYTRARHACPARGPA